MNIFSSSDNRGGRNNAERRSTIPMHDSTAAADSAVASGTHMPPFTASENAEYQAILVWRNAFLDSERAYQDVLMTLEGDYILDRFRAEYESLHNSLLSAHEGEGRLLRKCADLQTDIGLCAEKATAATELTQGDREIIARLKKETEHTSQRLTEMREKEMQLKEVVATLKQDIRAQQAKAQEPIELPLQETAINNLQHIHDSLQRKEEQLTQQLRSVSCNAAATQRRITALVEGNSANAAELMLVRENTTKMEEEVQAVLAQKSLKAQELSSMRDAIARRIAYSISQQQTLDALSEDHERNGQELREIRNEESRLTDEHQGICRQLQHVNTAMQECNEENDLWQRRAREKTAELKAHQATLASLHKRCVKAQEVVEALNRRNTVIEAQKTEQQERQRDAAARLQDEESNLARARQAARVATQTALSVRKEVNILQESIAENEGEHRRNASWLAEKQVQLLMLESVVTSCEENIQDALKKMYVMTQEAEMNDTKAKEYANASLRILNEIESKNIELGEYDRRFAVGEAQVQQQQTMLESTLMERNTYTSHCNQLKHGLSEQQHRIILHIAQIQSMRNAIQKREKDAQLQAAHIRLLRQQQKELEGHLDDYQRRAGKSQRSADVLLQEVQQLQSVLRDAAEETARQQRRCRDVVHERDLLGRQATDRTMEVYALYEKAHTQHSVLQRHEGLYTEQAQQLENLQYQTVQFAQQLKQMRMFVVRLPELRVLLNSSTRELQRERVRVRALLDEAGRSVNVHPHNEAALADPETYVLLQRVHKLQRVLVQRRAQLSEKDAAIQSVEQRYMRAKATAAQQPGPEIAEQLTAYQENLVKKGQHMEKMQEALAFFRSQTDLFKARHDVLRDRLTEMGKTYASNRLEQDRHSRVGHGGSATPDAGPLSLTPEPIVYRGFVAPPRPTTGISTTPPSLSTPPTVLE